VTQGKPDKTSQRSELSVMTRGEQIGAKLTQRSSRTALSWLLSKVALYGLDTPEMEGLLVSAFTAMEMPHIQSTSDRVRTLTPIYEHLQANGVTVSERADIAANILNLIATEAEWSVRRNGRGRTFITATPR
jgi:hypothetical protein